MRDLDAIARGGRARPVRLRRGTRSVLHLLRGCHQTFARALQLRPALLGALEPVPLLVHVPSHLGDQALRLRLGPGHGLARARLRRLELGLGPREQPRALRLAPLEQRAALGVLAIPVVEAGQQLLELPLLGGAMRVRPLDQRGGQAQAGADGERVALARAIVDEPEGGGEPLRIELHRRVAGPGMRGGEALERLEMGGGHDHRAALGQGLQHRLGQRGAVVGIGARAQLVEQHERAGVHALENLAELLDEGGERREVLRHALLVTDDGEALREDGQPRPVARGDVAARLRHEHEQAQGLERHRLAARVGAGDHEHRALGADLDVHGNDWAAALGRPALREQDRVEGAAQEHVALLGDRRLDGLHALGEGAAREDQVEAADAGHQGVELRQRRPHRVGQRGQDAEDLGLFLARGLDEIVVRLHHRLRLHEEGGPALRAVVHDAAQAALGFRADRQHVAAVADGDVALLERGVGIGPGEVGLEPLDELAPQVPDPLANAAQRGRRLVAHLAVGVERAPEQLGQLGLPREARERLREIGGHRLDGAAVGHEAPRRVQQRDQRGQVRGLGHRARHARALERGPHVRDALPGRHAGLDHRGPGLAGLAERAPDRAGIRERERGGRQLAAHRRPRFAREERQHLRPLEAAAARGEPERGGHARGALSGAPRGRAPGPRPRRRPRRPPPAPRERTARARDR